MKTVVRYEIMDSSMHNMIVVRFRVWFLYQTSSLEPSSQVDLIVLRETPCFVQLSIGCLTVSARQSSPNLSGQNCLPCMTCLDLLGARIIHQMGFGLHGDSKHLHGCTHRCSPRILYTPLIPRAEGTVHYVYLVPKYRIYLLAKWYYSSCHIFINKKNYTLLELLNYVCCSSLGQD